MRSTLDVLEVFRQDKISYLPPSLGSSAEIHNCRIRASAASRAVLLPLAQPGSLLWTTCIPSCYSSSEVAPHLWRTLPHPRYLSSSSSEVVALWRTLHPVPDSRLHLSS